MFEATVAAVGALTAIAFVLRLPHMGESLFGDEMYAYAEVHGRSLTEVVERVREGGENSPPLYFLLAWGAIQLGDPTVLMRLPSLVLGTATVPLVYLLGLQTIGRKGALIAAALMTFSPFAIFFASEARPYATLMFLVALSTSVLLLALESRQTRWWVLYGLTGCAVLYAHYFGIFPLVAQGGWALWTHRDRLRELVLVHAAIAVGYIPWILAFLDQKGNSIAILAFYKPLNVDGIARELTIFFAGHPSFRPTELPGSAVVAVVLLALAVAAVATGARLLRRYPGGLPKPSATLVLLALLAVATPLGFFLYSVAGPELFIARYLSGSLPALLLVVAAVLTSAPRAVSLAATAVVVVGVAIGAVASLSDERRRPPYKDAARFIDRKAREGDAVVQADLTLGATRSQVMRAGRQLSLDVNFERDHEVLSVFEEGDVRRAFARAARRPRFLLVGPEPLPRPPVGLGARLVEGRSFPGSLPLAVRVYAPSDPSTGFTPAGITEADEADRLRKRRAAALRRCLSGAGLTARRAETSPRGSIALELDVADGLRSLLYVYSSASDARRELVGIARFLEAAGGEAKRRREVVVGYTKPPSADMARRVEACA